MTREEVETKLESLHISWIDLQKFIKGYNNFTVRFDPDVLWEQAVEKCLRTGQFPK